MGVKKRRTPRKKKVPEQSVKEARRSGGKSREDDSKTGVYAKSVHKIGRKG